MRDWTCANNMIKNKMQYKKFTKLIIVRGETCILMCMKIISKHGFNSSSTLRSNLVTQSIWLVCLSLPLFFMSISFSFYNTRVFSEPSCLVMELVRKT